MTVFIGGMMREDSICQTQGETMAVNSFNEMLNVHADEQSMFLKSMGMSFGRGHGELKLTFEGAAELFWSSFIAPLQHH